jgi:hypothetical protein
MYPKHGSTDAYPHSSQRWGDGGVVRRGAVHCVVVVHGSRVLCRGERDVRTLSGNRTVVRDPVQNIELLHGDGVDLVQYVHTRRVHTVALNRTEQWVQGSPVHEQKQQEQSC